jgi:hypothetical protein
LFHFYFHRINRLLIFGGGAQLVGDQGGAQLGDSRKELKVEDSSLEA